MMGPIVAAENLVKEFPVSRGQSRVLRAVDGVSFGIEAGETLGLVGESGSGKSTTGRMLVGLIPVTSGRVTLFGTTVTGPGSAGRLASVRDRMQFVFQDPNGSLDPRMRVRDSIAEPLDIKGGLGRRARADRVAELLEMVGLPAVAAERYPHEFSGGQRQRIGIARALALRPEFIVCDEAVSALDVSMQAQIVNLLLDLQEKFEVAYLFIAHDLSVVRVISTRIAVMYAGAIVEVAAKAALYARPQHPYTQALLEAVPRPDPDRQRKPALAGEVPGMLDRGAGCAFSARCPRVQPACLDSSPALREVAAGHSAACHLL